MTDLEKIVNGEDIKIQIDVQSFAARSTQSNLKGIIFEFDIITENQEYYTIRVFYNDDTKEAMLSSIDDNTYGDVRNLFDYVEDDLEEFKEKALDWVTQFISEDD